jgi:ABC-type nitrate/sulfonate/bicarbonate transport system substrate-binding protein
LEQLGLEPKRDNITFLPIGDPVTMAHALETGRIDAVVLDPVLSRGLMSKGFSLLLDLFQAKVFFPGLGLGVTRAYLEQNDSTGERVVTALTESLAFIQGPANKPIVLKSMMKNLRMTDPAAAENGYQDQLLTLNRKPYPSLEGLHNAQRLMALQNPKIAILKIEDLIDSRFVRKLDENGFIDGSTAIAQVDNGHANRTEVFNLLPRRQRISAEKFFEQLHHFRFAGQLLDDLVERLRHQWW